MVSIPPDGHAPTALRGRRFKMVYICGNLERAKRFELSTPTLAIERAVRLGISNGCWGLPGIARRRWDGPSRRVRVAGFERLVTTATNVEFRAAAKLRPGCNRAFGIRGWTMEQVPDYADARTRAFCVHCAGPIGTRDH